MASKPRLVASLSLISGEAVKTKSFQEPRYLGDPMNFTRLFSRFEVDELAIFDFSERFDKQVTQVEVLEGILQSAFMPISYGGGVSNLEQAKRAFALGFDRVILKSLLNNSAELNSIASTFGQQAVVACLNVTKLNGVMEVNGEIMKIEDLCQYATRVSREGAGELLLHDVRQDGTRGGYSLFSEASELADLLDIPVSVMGGVRDIDEAAQIVNSSKVNSVVGSSMFVYHPTRDSVFVNYPKSNVWDEKLRRGMR
jgi:cyclase